MTMSSTSRPQLSSLCNQAINTQFKHTILWNSILANLKSQLLEANTNPGKLKKQHSRFVAASVGGMLLIKQNIIMNTTNTLNSLASHGHPPSPSKLTNSPLESIYFTGAQCIDLVYSFLAHNKESLSVEREVTREKCAKLCQTMMDSGIFESMSIRSSRLDDSSLKYYKFKSEYLKQSEESEHYLIKTELCDQDDNYHKKATFDSDKENMSFDENQNSLLDSNNNNKVAKNDGMDATGPVKLFNKSNRLINKTNYVNTKLKRKLTSMRRSSTMHALLPSDAKRQNTDESLVRVNVPSVLKNDERTVKLDRTKSIDSASKKYQNKCLNNSLVKELLVTRQITRELIIEKMLSLIDLPIIEHLLTIDEQNDVEYCEAIQSFDSMLINNMNSLNLNESMDGVFNKSNIKYINKSLECLAQSFDMKQCDAKDEWRKSVLEVLEFIDWHKSLCNKNQPKINDRDLTLVLMKDIELFNLVFNYYASKKSHFLHDSFQPLFSNILIFIKKSHYSKALEILNLASLLLLKQTQAELKRLLKFMYLTANSSHAPRLCEEKPNNSVLLNQFANCLISPKHISFEDSRLLLNFMLNNFDNLFRLTKSIEESISKRRVMVQNGHEEALLEQVYCKKLSDKEYNEKSKEETSKGLIDLINHIIDDPQISLKHKKLKLKALQRIHPDVYEKNFANIL